MQRTIPTSPGVLAVLVALLTAGCGAASTSPTSTPSQSALASTSSPSPSPSPSSPSALASTAASGSMEMRAHQDVLISMEPLEDVMVGNVPAGEVVTAVCFVPEAQTQAGDIGSAVKIESEHGAGYVPVTNFPPDPADRKSLFDVEEDTLRNNLPICSDK